MILVLDACAMIAYLRGEPGGDVVGGLLADAANRAYAHAVNVCEVYYDALRRGAPPGPTRLADEAVALIEHAGVEIREDLDGDLWRHAAARKAHRRMSLADAFAVALTQRLGATLVTSDHHEFDAVAEERVCPVLFIR